MIVVDASVLVNLLVFDDHRGSKARAVLANDPEWTAPSHWTVEVFSGIRGLLLGSRISARTAQQAVTRLPRLAVENIPPGLLLARIWRLRASLSGYDAAYVALAELRGIALVTADAPLARAASQFCRVELAN